MPTASGGLYVVGVSVAFLRKTAYDTSELKPQVDGLMLPAFLAQLPTAKADAEFALRRLDATETAVEHTSPGQSG